MSDATVLCNAALQTFTDSRWRISRFDMPTLLITVSPKFRMQVFDSPNISQYLDLSNRNTFCGHEFQVVNHQAEDFRIWVLT